MTQKDSDWIRNLFATDGRDWTPVSAQGQVFMLFAPFSRNSEVPNRCAAILSGEEVQRAGRFLANDDGAHFIQRRAFRRYCGAVAVGSTQHLSRILFEETVKGRPYIADRPNIWFSFSSCRFGFLGAWSSTYRIGVDIEDKTRNVEPTELAQRFFSEAEAKAVERVLGLERLWTFFRLWCLKEAALKTIGEGLPFGLDAFQFEFAPDVRVVHAPDNQGGRELFSPHLIDDTDTCTALVIRHMA